MSTVEWTQDAPEWDHEVPENSVEEDDKLSEYWAKKERRRSSIFKDFVGDSLGLKENQRICMYITKLGKLSIASCVCGIVLLLSKFAVWIL